MFDKYDLELTTEANDFNNYSISNTIINFPTDLEMLRNFRFGWTFVKSILFGGTLLIYPILLFTMVRHKFQKASGFYALFIFLGILDVLYMTGELLTFIYPYFYTCAYQVLPNGYANSRVGNFLKKKLN